MRISRPVQIAAPRRPRPLAAALALLAAAALLLAGLQRGQAPTTARGLAQRYGSLPLSFQPNRGQSAAPVRFLSTGAGYGLFLTAHRAVLTLPSPGRPADRAARSNPDAVLTMRLVGSRAAPRIGGQGRLPGRVNYLGGPGSRSETGIPTFAAVRYAEVWPGIGMRFYGNRRRLEYDFELAPGASAGAIGLRFSGQRRLRIDRAGDLAIDLGTTTVHQLRPRAYQLLAGVRHRVPSRYVWRHGHIGIALGAYDHSRPLTIDPRLVYSTYLGRGIDGRGYSIAVDSSGSSYVTGYTTSPRFPITPGAVQTKYHGGTSGAGAGQVVAFVSKLDRSGRRLVYSTYLGGHAGSSGAGIAVDRNGDAFVTGLAYPGFPTTQGAFQAQPPGFENAFVAKLSPSGRRLLYSTYLGAPGEDGGLGAAIAIDSGGDAYVVGYTFSAEFPTTPGAARTSGDSSHATDAFLTKLDPSGSHLVYSTYLGGSADDDASGIVVGPDGDAYVTGSTSSKDFPITPGAFQQTNRAEHEFTNAFVTRLNSSGSQFLYSTYLGGKGLDQATGIAVDPGGDAYVTGEATSSDFPTTKDAFQSQRRGFAAAFVATLSPDGQRLLHSTLLGGGGLGSKGRAIAIDRAGNVYVAGFTGSKDFPLTRGAVQRANHSPRNYNGFLTKLNPAGSKLLYSTYLGGQATRAASIALDPLGAAYLTGGTGPGFPTKGGLRLSTPSPSPSYPSAFVAKLRP